MENEPPAYNYEIDRLSDQELYEVHADLCERVLYFGGLLDEAETLMMDRSLPVPDESDEAKLDRIYKDIQAKVNKALNGNL